ncbi:MAG: polysaccharide biosynthesis tyrosine autokinase [Deltaproteobacteria bacterium]|nr:polysaccharide biosynthesis tyrosine autokinase [Deltaproteobacteria bacterium]
MHVSEEEIHLRDYWKIFLKRRNVAFLTFAVIAGISATYSFTAKPVYEGSTQVLVDLENNPTMTFTEGGSPYLQMKSFNDYFNTQKQILTSRTFADRVVRKLQLDKSLYFQAQKRANAEALLPSIKAFIRDSIKSFFPDKKPSSAEQFLNIQPYVELDMAITNMLLDNMTVVPGGKANILRINFASGDPKVAAAMANAIADTYIEHNLDIRVKPYKDAVEWLSARMVDLRTRVEESEKVLQLYREGKGIVSFESKDNVLVQRLQELVTQLVQSGAKRQETEVKYNQIKSVIDKPELLSTVPDIMNNMVIQNLRIGELDLRKKISELSEKYGPKHPQMVRAKTELEVVRKNLLDEARKMLSAAKTDFDIALSRENSIKKTIEEQKIDVLDFGRKAIEFNVVAGEADSNKRFYELLLKKLQEASLSSGITISNVQVVDRSVTPVAPVSPQKGLYTLLGALIGAFTGIFLAFFVDYMDDTVKTPEEVEKLLRLPFLGVIPAIKEKEKGMIFVSPEAKTPIAESYRTLMTSVIFASIDKSPQVILVTSGTPNEGKTTTSSNLAAAMAGMGEKVLLIDADLRKSAIHKTFDLDNSTGLTNLIMEGGALSAHVKNAAGIPSLDILTSGAHAPNPSELLSSTRISEFIAEAKKKYTRIILDSPPVMAVSDPLLICRHVDGVVLVAWGGMITGDLLKRTSQMIANVNAKVLGVCLNNVKITRRSGYQYYPYYSYGYGYGYGYGESSGKKRKT